MVCNEVSSITGRITTHDFVRDGASSQYSSRGFGFYRCERNRPDLTVDGGDQGVVVDDVASDPG